MLSNQKNMTSWLKFFSKSGVPPSFRKHAKALAKARPSLQESSVSERLSEPWLQILVAD